jgi:uncharacterized membrane-anchored protein YitT (DUF2179 family)
MKKTVTYLAIILMALACALNYQLFVFPNKFAPAGLNGICTMIQYLSGVSMGYLSLVINIPLAIAVYFLVSKSLAFRSMLYVLCFSAFLVVLDKVDLSAFVYSTDTSTILGPLVGGIINGSCATVLISASAYSGGTDFVASLIHKYRPEINFFWIVFTLNALVAFSSYFVYGYQIEPVLLCVLYSFTTSTIMDKLAKNGRSAVRFEIVTEHPEDISQAIIHELHHGATLIPGKGVYKGKEMSVLVCVVNKTQVALLTSIVQRYPNTFTTTSLVSEVVGNFKRLNNRGLPEKQLLDKGDAKRV